MIFVIGFIVLAISTVSLAAVSYKLGKRKGEEIRECCCYNCKKNGDCVIYIMSDCNWCEQFEWKEEKDGEV